VKSGKNEDTGTMYLRLLTAFDEKRKRSGGNYKKKTEDEDKLGRRARNQKKRPSRQVLLSQT